MARSDVEGFEIAFHSSLSEPVTIAGVPRMIAVLNGTLAAVLALGLQVPLIGIPLGLAAALTPLGIDAPDPELDPTAMAASPAAVSSVAATSTPSCARRHRSVRPSGDATARRR